LAGTKDNLLTGFSEVSKKFVYEISNIELLPGIEKAEYPSDRTYDFIVCFECIGTCILSSGKCSNDV